MRKVKTTWPTFSWQELVRLKDVFDRFMSFARAPDLAAFILKGDLRRNGRLRPIVVYLSADKKHMVTHLNPSNCDKHVQALAGDVMEPPVNGYCFVPRVDVDKHPIAATPTMTAPHQSDDVQPPKPRRRKPGPKIKKGWRLRVAGEANRIMENEKRIPSAEELAQFCENKLGYQPDERAIQKLLRDLLGD
jgi:hypothetical protein